MSTRCHLRQGGLGLSRRDLLKTGVSAGAMLAAGPHASPKPGGILRVRGWDPPHFDPHLTRNFMTMTTLSFVYSKLLRHKVGAGVTPGSFSVESDLAERWEQPDDATYIFHLRKGVRWHNEAPVNGRELTAEDVKFTYTRRSSLQVVRPETVVGWHRQGFRRYWAWKSRRRCGRPGIEMELRDLIPRVSRANPLWGAPRIHGELLKLGLTVSQATISKYMLRQRKPPSQTWRAFLKNHAKDLIAVDFFTVPTATFRIRFVLVVLRHDRRRLVHFNVTEHPTAEWTARQLVEACALEETPGHLIRDRDQVYGERFSCQARALNIREVVIAPRSPWQNAYAERVIGSIRRECLDHMVVIGERHLKRLLSEYVHYYNTTRTHLSLAKDTLEPRSVQPPSQGRVVEVPCVGGLHHEYLRRTA